MEQQEKKYLKFYNKAAYGCGDMATNFNYTFVTAFILLYLSNTMGMSPGICGTLILVSKLLDGVTDVIFGTFIDNTKSKLGKARPWMLYTILPMAVCEILLFAVPASMGKTAQYAYFFIIYVLLNCIFYTANNVAYSTLAVFITRSKSEQVQIGVFRYIFAVFAGMVVSGGTMTFVAKFGGGAAGWRNTAILYSVLFMIIMLLCVLGTKELPPEQDSNVHTQASKNVLHNLKYCLKNPYYILLILGVLLFNGVFSMGSSSGSFFVIYVLGDEKAVSLAYFSISQMIPLIVGLILTPMLVKRVGVYRSILTGLGISFIGCVVFAVAGIHAQPLLPVMLAGNAIRWFGLGPLSGSSAALIAETSGYTKRGEGVNIDGTMFSCNSMGTKLGGGIFTALTGWMLEAAGFISSTGGGSVAQPASAITMIRFIYAVVPLIVTVAMGIIYYFIKVEKKNKEWDEEYAK